MPDRLTAPGPDVTVEVALAPHAAGRGREEEIAVGIVAFLACLLGAPGDLVEVGVEGAGGNEALAKHGPGAAMGLGEEAML